MNALTGDLATGLTTAMTKDGQSTPTANLTMGTFKLTNLGDATTAGDALRFNGAAGTPSSIILTNATGLLVPGGGTGKNTLTAHGVLVGNAAGAVSVTSAGTTGQVLTSNGSGADPTFQAATSGSVTSVAGAGTVNGITLTGTVTTSGNLTLGGTLANVNLATQMSLAASSIAANGYLKIGTLVIQWGVSSNLSGGTQSVSFPITFPTAVFSVQASISSATAAKVSVNSIDATGFAVNSDLSGVPAYWIAIGN